MSGVYARLFCRGSSAYLIPPSVFSTLTSPRDLSPCALTFLSSSRFSGMMALRVSLRSGSEAEAYVRAPDTGRHFSRDNKGGISYDVSVRDVMGRTAPDYWLSGQPCITWQSWDFFQHTRQACSALETVLVFMDIMCSG